MTRWGMRVVYLGLDYFKMVLAGKKKTSKFGQDIYTIVQNLYIVALQYVCKFYYA